MKKIFILICLLILSIMPAYSKTLKMLAEPQESLVPELNKKVSVKIVGNYNFINNSTIYGGTVIKGHIVSVIEPKIGKRDGYVYIQVTEIIGHDGKINKVDNPNAVVKLSKYEPIDIKEKTMDVGVSAAGFLVKNISYPINFVRGAISPEDGQNRVSSGLNKAFDKSVFSYINDGQEFSLDENKLITVTFKYKNSKQDKNSNEDE